MQKNHQGKSNKLAKTPAFMRVITCLSVFLFLFLLLPSTFGVLTAQIDYDEFVTSPNSLHLNQDNWATDPTNWLYWSTATDTLYFNSSMLTPTYYNITAYQIVRGVYVSGDLDALNAYNATEFQLTEQSGTPGLDFRLNYTGVDDFNNIYLRFRTDATHLHNSVIQLYDYDDDDWEDYYTYTALPSYNVVSIPVFDAINHIENGVVQLRFYMADAGNPSHNLYIDWASIAKGFGTPSGEEVDTLQSVTDRGATTKLPITTPAITSSSITNTSGVEFGNTNNAFLYAGKTSGFALTGGDSLTDNNAKLLRVGVLNYNNEASPVTLFAGYSSSEGGGSSMSIGGGTSLGGAMQYHYWYIGTGMTPTGTQVGRLSQVGLMLQPQGVGQNPSAALHIIKTTEQTRIGYDTNNYWTDITALDGGRTIKGYGSDPDITYDLSNSTNAMYTVSNTAVSATGKVTAINAPATYEGAWVDFQKNGASKLQILGAYSAGGTEPVFYNPVANSAVLFGNPTGYLRVLPWLSTNSVFFQSSLPNFDFSKTGGVSGGTLGFRFNVSKFYGKANIGAIEPTIQTQNLNVQGSMGISNSLGYLRIVTSGGVNYIQSATTDTAGSIAPLRFTPAGSSTSRFAIESTEVVVNDAGANLDFRVEGDTVTNLLWTDASADTINTNGKIIAKNANFTDTGSEYAIKAYGATTGAIYASDATGVITTLSDGSGVTSYGASGEGLTLASSGIAGYFYDASSNQAWLADAISAGYFDDGPNYVRLADGTDAIDASGDVYVNGKVTATGGFDPPYVLIDEQTKQQIVERTRREIPTGKASGLAIVNIPSDTRVKWFKPLNCGFYGEKIDREGWLNVILIETFDDGKGICYNNNVTTRYVWDSIEGQVKQRQIAKVTRISLNRDLTVDDQTGEIITREVLTRR